MTIEKAIEILEDDLNYCVSGLTPDFLDAIKLGVEALKRHQVLTKHPYFQGLQPLPGETED